MTARKCDQYTAQGLPVWEVQGYGTVTDAGRRDVRPPWIDVRLALADGARVDVLAVVRGDRIAIEDAQADPPLTLESLAALPAAIEGPLRAACASVTGPLPAAPTVGDHSPSAPIGAGRSDEGVSVSEGDAHHVPHPDPVGSGVWEPATGADDTGRTRNREAPAWTASGEGDLQRPAVPPTVSGQPEHAVPDEARASGAIGGAATDVDGCGIEAGGANTHGHRRARGILPRGAGARRAAALAYLSAQRDGRDPVLAVMDATGLSRRRSLRLIAGARDEGHLPAGRHRR